MIDKKLLLKPSEIQDIVGTKYAELMAGYYQTKTALEWKVIKDKAIAQAQLKKAQDYYEPLIEKAREEDWIDKPTKGGMYWMSPFCDGRYRLPFLLKRVIDYGRPTRGLEVEEGHIHYVPIDLYRREYYPRAKWLYIPEPSMEALKKQIEEGGKIRRTIHSK